MNAKQSKLIDTLPTLAPSSKGGKEEIPSFNQDVLPEEVVRAVETFVIAGAQLALAEASQAAEKPLILTTATSLLDDMAQEGQFLKSVKLVTEAGQVCITRTDKFSIAKDTTMSTLTGAFGDEFVDKYFESETEVMLNPAVLKDGKLLKELIDKVGSSDFARFFVKVETLKAKKGLDVGIFELPPDKRELARNGIVKQASASVK